MIVEWNDKNGVYTIFLSPTVPHCSLMLTIGLSIRLKLIREFSKLKKIKLDILIVEGKHQQKKESKYYLTLVDKQLNDKERYLAALENNYIVNELEPLIKNKCF